LREGRQPKGGRKGGREYRKGREEGREVDCARISQGREGGRKGGREYLDFILLSFLSLCDLIREALSPGVF